MSADPRTIIKTEEPRIRIVPKPKSASGDSIQRGSKDQEIENLKRLLANVSQRLDALKTR